MLSWRTETGVRRLSTFECGWNIGVVTSGVVVGILGAWVVTGTLAEVWGWWSVYAVLAVLSLGLAALVLVALPSEERLNPTARYRQVVASLGGLFGQRIFLTRGLIAFFLFAPFGTLWSGLSLPLADTPWELSESQIGLFGIAGLAGALGAGRWADAGRAAPVTGGALTLLILSWAAIAQLPWSLWLLIVGIVVLDFAVQAVHVSNQHLLTAAHPDRVSSVIGSYMVSTHSAPPSAQPQPPPPLPPTAGRAPVSSGPDSQPARWPSGRPTGDYPTTARTSSPRKQARTRRGRKRKALTKPDK